MLNLIRMTVACCALSQGTLAHIHCAKNNTMLIHGCKVSQHANDTLKHYNAYRKAYNQSTITCDKKTEFIIDENGNFTRPASRCIKYVMDVAAWKMPEIKYSSATTAQPMTSASYSASTPKTIEEEFSESFTSTLNSVDETKSEKRKGSNIAIIVAISIIVCAALIAAAWIINEKCKSNNHIDMVIVDNNPVYEIPNNPVYELPVNPDQNPMPLYDNIRA